MVVYIIYINDALSSKYQISKNGVGGDDVDDKIIIIIIIIIWYLLTRCLNNTSACYKASTEINTTQKQYKYTKMKQQ